MNNGNREDNSLSDWSNGDASWDSIDNGQPVDINIDQGQARQSINNDNQSISQNGINLNKNPDSSTSNIRSDNVSNNISRDTDMYNMSPVYIDDSADVIPARTSMY